MLAGVDSGTPRRWSEGALVGIALYVLIDLVLVFLRPHLSVLHSAESDYASEGRFAWVMDANFVLRCLFSFAVVGALVLTLGELGRAPAGVLLLAVWALASGLLAGFPDDPAGTKLDTAGRVHLLLAAIAFLSVLVGTFLTTRVLRTDARFAPVRGLLVWLAVAATAALLLLARSRLRPHSLGGLYEKLFLGLELAWFATVARQITRLEFESPTQPHD